MENSVVLDLNPGTQGASLTEGKRSKRKGQKQNGDVNGDRSGSPKSEEESELIVAPSKVDKVRAESFLEVSSFSQLRT